MKIARRQCDQEKNLENVPVPMNFIVRKFLL